MLEGAGGGKGKYVTLPPEMRVRDGSKSAVSTAKRAVVTVVQWIGEHLFAALEDEPRKPERLEQLLVPPHEEGYDLPQEPLACSSAAREDAHTMRGWCSVV